jgi:antitoxin ParD1/3/4
MPKVEKLSVALTSELAEDVREAIRVGDYASVSEVVREALRDWISKREERAAAIQRVRELWNEGIASGIAEEREPLDKFLARNRQRLAKNRAA